MDLFSLTATLGLDASSFTSGIGIAKTAFGGLTNLVTSGLATAGRATADFLRDVVDTGMGFDRQMSAVQAVLGREEGTVENMNRLREHGLDVAHDSIFTAEQVAQAYYYMGLAGWKTEQQLAGLQGIVDLAAASGEDLAVVSDIVTDSITAFGLTADDVSKYVDILAATVTNSNTDVAQLGNAFKYAAPVAGALGADVDDVALSLGLMANAGIKASQAGTSMRQMFTRLANNTNNARDTIEKLGVSVFDSEGNMRDWGDIITDSRKAWHGLTQEQQASYAATIAGQRGMSGWLAMMNASEDDVEKLSRAIAEANGSAREMSETRLDNLWGDIEMFNASLDVLKVAIFDDIKGPMRDVVQYGTAALDRITQAVNERGLTGGIEQLGIEIESLGEKFAPMLESLGTSLAPLVSSLFTSVIPSLGGAAIELGSSLGKGILQGIKEELGETVVSEMIGQVINGGGLGGVLKVAENALFGKNKQYTGADLGVTPERTSMGRMEASTIAMRAQTNAEAIQAAIDEARGAATLTINNVTMSTEQWQAVVDGLTSEPLEFDADVDEEAISADITTATAGPYNVGLSADTSGVVSSIGTALSGRTFGINVHANVTGLPGTQKNARGMGAGYVFNRPTIFGYADGKLQMAGEAGPEAVVGVHSLNAMIQQSVAQAVKGIASAAAPARGNPAPMVMTLDGRVFARLQSSNTARADNARNKSIALGYGR